MSLTQGNLAGHLRKMEEAGYVAIYKSFVGRRPNTSYSLTSTGQEAFNTYREKIKEIGARLG